MPVISGYLIDQRHLPMVAQAVIAFARDRKLAGSPLPADALAEVEAIARAVYGSPTDTTGSAAGTGISTQPVLGAVLTSQWCSVGQAAGLLGCTPSYVRRLARSGSLAGYMASGVWLIDRASIDERSRRDRR